MTITIPREVVRQACVAFTTPWGGRWIEHDVEVIVGGETMFVSVRLEVQPEAALSREAEIARSLHSQLEQARSAIQELQSIISGGEFLQPSQPAREA